MSEIPEKQTRIQLLQKAAQCYEKAGWLADACRVWEQLGEYQQAAKLHEEQSNWEKAAQCYQQAKNWSNAARCYLLCSQPETAANCWLQAGETLQAAWIWADSLKQVYRIKDELKGFIPQSETQVLELELITARCHANNKKPRESALIIRQQLEQLLKLLTPSRRHLYTWSLRIATVITRPDLSALIYATAYRAKLPNVCKEWEIWALETLGDATGIPQEEAASEEPSYEFEVVTVNNKGEIIQREWNKARYFHYGKTITSEFVNFNRNLRETTDVGSFPPNRFGLYDMHGNVLEWCADPWHSNYEGAPNDGSVWLENGNDNDFLLRGGSWDSNSGYCRSAYRDDYDTRDDVINDVGFRVSCGVGRT
ncbi:MAG: SUMF1/EgtB/PvdO family nonheme iron enzyme [Cyanobacteria bacterium P01_A01_bin.80]